MPRHPGAQADNRLREILPKLHWAVNEMRCKRYEIAELRSQFAKKLAQLEKEREEADLLFETAQSLIRRLSRGDGGLYPWGLPPSITIAEFRAFAPEADIDADDKEPPKEGVTEAGKP